MKTLLSLAVIIMVAGSALGQATVDTVDKSKRMLQIEKKFDIVMVLVSIDKDLKYWVFKSAYEQGAFGFVPVMVKEGATDKEVTSAIVASKACATFYDNMLKRAAQAHQQGQQPMVFEDR